ncbi:DUF1289 domain-containing protein [Cereibacter sphaeroides]|uniref:DUF1289 domain-containing protein n=1 Tax=Cereibacter sphaeroides TaxID=1063 RepID=UPI003990B95B
MPRIVARTDRPSTSCRRPARTGTQTCDARLQAVARWTAGRCRLCRGGPAGFGEGCAFRCHGTGRAGGLRHYRPVDRKAAGAAGSRASRLASSRGCAVQRSDGRTPRARGGQPRQPGRSLHRPLQADPESGICLGCARSREEIGLWGSASEAEGAAGRGRPLPPIRSETCALIQSRAARGTGPRKARSRAATR